MSRRALEVYESAAHWIITAATVAATTVACKADRSPQASNSGLLAQPAQSVSDGLPTAVPMPGAGIRIPMPNRVQLRVDARDAILFGSPTGRTGQSRTTHNLEFTGALGITF